jgi:hypothetical protein
LTYPKDLTEVACFHQFHSTISGDDNTTHPRPDLRTGTYIGPYAEQQAHAKTRRALDTAWDRMVVMFLEGFG